MSPTARGYKLPEPTPLHSVWARRDRSKTDLANNKQIESPSRPHRLAMACDILSVDKRKDDSGSNLQSKLNNLDAKSGFIADVIVAHEDEPNLMESDREPNQAFVSQKKLTQLTFNLQSEYKVEKENDGRRAQGQSRDASSINSMTSNSATGKQSKKNFLEGRTHQIKFQLLSAKANHTAEDPRHSPYNHPRHAKSPNRSRPLPPVSPLPSIPQQLKHSYVQDIVRFDSKNESVNTNYKQSPDDIMTVRAIKICEAKTVVANAKVTSALQKGSKLSYQLNLSNCGIKDVDLVNIFSPPNKKTFQNKTEINVSSNQITNDGLSIILSRMSEMDLKIGVINASKNDIDERCLPLILKFVKNHKNDLTDIDLTKNRIDQTNTLDLVQEIRVCGVMVVL